MENFIKNLARGAGKILREGFGKKTKVLEKTGYWDVVTEYDLKVDRFVVGKIRTKFPNHGILTEESGQISKGGTFWILDPIDGTWAFRRGKPQFCTAISLVVNNHLELGAIYDPMVDELFFAKAKRGAFLNGRKIFVTNKPDVYRSNIALDLWLNKNAPRVFSKLLREEILPPGNLGSAALHLAYCAAGRFDAAVVTGGHSWDYSAGALIMKEAGAKVTDLKGRPYKWNFAEVLAANPRLHSQILKLIG